MCDVHVVEKVCMRGRRERGGRVRVHVYYFMYKVVYHEYCYVVVLCDVCSHLIS